VGVSCSKALVSMVTAAAALTWPSFANCTSRKDTHRGDHVVSGAFVPCAHPQGYYCLTVKLTVVAGTGVMGGYLSVPPFDLHSITQVRGVVGGAVCSTVYVR
jgi:hypothetical protein